MIYWDVTKHFIYLQVFVGTWFKTRVGFLQFFSIFIFLWFLTIAVKLEFLLQMLKMHLL